MSDCIKPRTKVSVFGSLEGTAGGWVHMPRLDLCILSRWSPSYKTRWLAFLLKFYRIYSRRLNTAWTHGFIFYPNDILWDGQNCTSTSTCCQLNNPPWFTKNLPNATTDDIELRLCTIAMIQYTMMFPLNSMCSDWIISFPIWTMTQCMSLYS